MAEIFSIFFIFIIVCVILSVVFILFKAIRIFTLKNNFSNTHNQSYREGPSFKTKKQDNGAKVFSKDEGEYVSFEEIKDDDK